jgi:flagellar basal-body rod protein FlgF
MGDGIYTALTGAMAQQHALDIVANNVANAHTVGFRGDRAVFGELVKKTGGRAANPPGVPRPDRFVEVPSVVRDMSDGSLRRTGNPLDLALQGEGFFVVRTGDGDQLTRAGTFLTTPEGTLVTHEGAMVLGADAKPIHLPTNTADIQVSPSGEITSGGQHVGQLLLATVSDPMNLRKVGNSTLEGPADGKLGHATNVQVAQGFLEISNVNAVAGLNELIAVNRTFDALQKAIETFNKMDERCARELGARAG